VFVVDGDRARLRLVSAGPASAGGAERRSAAPDVLEVLSGLDTGDRVVINPPPGLRDSARVRSAPPVDRARDAEGS
jgi:hypothetical protein